ncbi:MAG TPA: DUF1028 domain-containing protein [Candidatus Binatia bacterium]|jgi:uncharacterized Ntn-hydrolase superfamily protein
MTFSLLGYDKDTGSVGICSLTATPAHGMRCPHFLKDVGVVTTQGMTNACHGVTCIDLLSSGFAPSEALQQSMIGDKNIECRQIAIVNCRGRMAAFTGGETRDVKGHIVSDSCVAAGNILFSEEVLPAMVDGFYSTKGELADRLLAGCEAGERKGGEVGGAHSGFIIVIRPDQISGWGRAYIELRNDYSSSIISSLRESLLQYRRWASERLDNRRYSLDDEPPANQLRLAAYPDISA